MRTMDYDTNLKLGEVCFLVGNRKSHFHVCVAEDDKSKVEGDTLFIFLLKCTFNKVSISKNAHLCVKVEEVLSAAVGCN